MLLEVAILIISALANVVLGMFVLYKNHRSHTNRLFFALTLAFATWSVVNYFSTHPVLWPQIIWVRLVLFLASLLCFLLYTTFRVFPNRQLTSDRRVVKLTAIYTLVVMFLTLTPFVFSDLRNIQGNVEPIVAPGIIFFVSQVIGTIVGSIYIIIKKLHRASGRERQQIKYLLAGVTTTFSLIIATSLVPVVLFGYTGLVPFGAAFTLCFSAAVTYSIVRHHLLNIGAVVARSVAFTMLLITLAFFMWATVIGLSYIFFDDSRPAIGQQMVYVGVAVILAFAFQPMRRFFESLTDRVFYRSRYNSREVLSKFSKLLVSELDLGRILKRALAELTGSLHVQYGQLVIFNNDRVYRVEHYGQLPRRLMVAPELAKLNQPMLVADELEGGERKRLMEDHGIRVSMTLRTREEFVGYLLLGDKLSGDIYSKQDIDLLEIIGKELAVAILNAKAYAQIQEFNLTLQARVDHATNRLRVANRHLKELDRAKDEFISMASHQLRTPLTTIKGYLSMMLEGDAGKLTKPQEEFVNYAFTSSERMVNLISDLLNVSRLSAGRFLIQTKPTDMVAMIQDEVRQLASHATSKGIQLIFEPPAEPLPPAEIDDNKTRQVVMNFIDNAIYYTPSGEVRVVLEQSGDKVRLEVRDTGIGVPEKARRKLFSKFFRADNAQITRPDGTGLGLYLAKRVVEDQGGTIIFNSVEGKGSTFGFELPFKPNKPIREVAHAHKRRNT